MRGAGLFLGVAAMVAAAAGHAGAQGMPVGPEFLLNVSTAGDQTRPAIAVEGDGGYVVAWLSGTSAIVARRLDPTGAPRSPEIAVNVTPIGAAARPAVAAFPGGGFVIAWHAPDGWGQGIFVRRFNAAGQPVGSEFAVNINLAGDQIDPKIAAGPFGYVMAWTSGTSVVGRLLGADGTPLGVEIPVGAGQSPAVAWRANGIVFAWTAADHLGPVYVRLFEGTGAPSGGAFVANEANPPMPGCFPGYTRTAIGVTSAADGSFTASWDLSGFSACGGFMPIWTFQFGSFIRRYAQNGVALGPEIQVNVYTAGAQRDPSVGRAASGTMFVAWSSIPEFEGCHLPPCFPPPPPPPPQDGSGAGAYARLFDAGGADVGGGEFRVNATTLGDQHQPSVAVAGPQKALAVFVQTDGSGAGIFARVFGHALTPARLEVDPTDEQFSDGNGVLENWEAVLLAPAWTNATGAAQSLTGTVSSFTGPPGPTYQISHPTAEYGVVPDGATRSCLQVAHCPTVAVFGARPAVHWDAAFTETIFPGSLAGPRTRILHIGDSFADVPRSSPFYRFVENVFHNGVMDGCASGWFCPFVSVPREEMALFVLKAVQPAFVPPACVAGAERFADVPASSPYCRWIEELARRGVVSGCGGGNYCPQGSVTREAMAVYLLVTREGTGYAPPACTAPLFNDVPASSPFCRWIEELARRGIVGGCGAGQYCPTGMVARDQMSVFLSGTFGLLLYVP